MNCFLQLVGFEYKKIAKRRGALLALALALITTILLPLGTLIGSVYEDGAPVETQYAAMQTDRAYARALSGRPIDAALLMEAAAAYAQVPDSTRYTQTPEYKTHARPYSEIYGIARAVYNTASQRFNMEDFQSLSAEQAASFYALRQDQQANLLAQYPMSERAKSELTALDAQVETPFRYSYYGGYQRFLGILYTVGLLLAFSVSVCIAPLFAGEYTSGADQLLLSARHGKGKLIGAKLFTGFSLTAAASLVLTGLTYLTCMLAFGPDGVHAPIQLMLPLCAYPLTFGQAALIFSLCVLLAALMTSALTMLLSARMKSPFGVIILISVLLVAPMYIRVPVTMPGLYNLVQLLPSNMMERPNVFDTMQFELFGLVLHPWQAMLLAAGAVTVLLTPFAIRAFKRHQIC